MSRHEAVPGPLIGRFLQVLVAVFFPVIVVAGAVRAVTSPLFLLVEYQRPGFRRTALAFPLKSV